MSLLAGTVYDPAAAVSLSLTSLKAMTAVDTTNLRLTFTAPTNGNVLVRLNCEESGNVTEGYWMLGVLSGATVIGRQYPITSATTALTPAAGTYVSNESLFTVTGLSGSQTWDAAYAVQVVGGTSSGINYGGPNNGGSQNAWGGFTFEVYTADKLLASTLYDPTTAASNATSALQAMTAIDTTNLRLTFTAPSSGNVLVRIRVSMTGSTTGPSIMLGVLDGSTVRLRKAAMGGYKYAVVASGVLTQEVSGVVTGLTGGNSFTWDAAYAVMQAQASSNIKYGGPNNTTGNNAWGGILYEIWAV